MKHTVPTIGAEHRATHRRRKKLIDPTLQLKLSFQFMAVAASALLLQFVFVSYFLASLSMKFPAQSQELFAGSYGMMIWVFVVTMGVFLPLATVLGVRATHRVAGPVYRFTQFLRAIERGERPADCRLRKGDYLKDFCEVLNSATAPLRRAPAMDEEVAEEDAEERAAA